MRAVNKKLAAMGPPSRLKLPATSYTSTQGKQRLHAAGALFIVHPVEQNFRDDCALVEHCIQHFVNLELSPGNLCNELDSDGTVIWRPGGIGRNRANYCVGSLFIPATTEQLNMISVVKCEDDEDDDDDDEDEDEEECPFR